jgi:hypothetical protein
VATSAAQDTPANLALSDLALDAAIELERLRANPKSRLEALETLSKALSERGLDDLALVPVYDRALASSGKAAPSSKSDLYSRLQSIVAKLQSSDTASADDLSVLRDFCVALHDALLTNRLQTIRDPALGQRRLN